MILRGFSPRTREAYIGAVAALAKHYENSPDQISHREIQSYLLYMIQERKLSWSTCSQAVHAIRFLLQQTLDRDSDTFHIPAQKKPSRLPEILSRQEVSKILHATTNEKHHLVLATTYATGVRVIELVNLKITNINMDRMTIRIGQGKGVRDRYLPLATRLHKLLQSYWEPPPPPPP
ncbi:MAG: phage integrase N-terminal SAM-like domain-containing protein, partial [Candidatus Eisenbacteria sp.]|nr:phage integrase N-terminal SAM-like domain-containing protein [Candidatus Eisenbacteria bacterium]